MPTSPPPKKNSAIDLMPSAPAHTTVLTLSADFRKWTRDQKFFGTKEGGDGGEKQGCQMQSTRTTVLSYSVYVNPCPRRPNMASLAFSLRPPQHRTGQEEEEDEGDESLKKV